MQPQPQAREDSFAEVRFERLTRLFFALGFLLALFGVCSGAIASADTWWHLATGRWILAHHAVPHSDPFSFATAGKPWVAHEYLSDVLMFLLHRSGGFIALAAANALVLTLAFATVASSARAPRWTAWVAALFAAVAARPAFALRPQSISLLFAAAFVWIIRRYFDSHNARWLIAPPCLMLLWVQLHAGYLLGIALLSLLLGAEILDWAAKRSETKPRDWLPVILSTAACTAVVPLNPSGFKILTFPFFVMRMKINANIQEWQSPNLRDPHLYPFIALAIATLLALLVSRSRYRPGQFLIYALLLAAALKSARNIPVFCLLAATLLADHLRVPEPRRGNTRLSPALQAVAAALFVAVAGYFCSSAAANGLAFQATAEKTLYPRAAVTYLAEHRLPGNVLNDYAFGGYMIWRLYPQYQVFVDGRADLYGDEFLAQYLEIYDGNRDPRPFLEGHRINTVMVAPSAGLANILRMLAVQGSWRLEYQDARAVIFIRTPAQ